MTTALVWDAGLARYDFGAGHPMRPERFVLAYDLARAYGMLDPAGAGDASHAAVIPPSEIPESDLLLVHAPELVEAVKAAGEDPLAEVSHYGIGVGDTPAFAQMHEVALAVCSATATALDAVLDGRFASAFSPAGGLHHAHRDRAAGFCVYNDCAVAIARATLDRPGLRVAYIDIDAHHGDGVEEAFYERADVLTVSVHESGLYLYPGTGFVPDTGRGEGAGYALNLPLPPGADDECYRIAFDDAIAPAVAAFGPDVIVAQLGADAHRNDPLTALGLSVAGHELLSRRIVALAENCCEGRLAATGGGGYDTFNAAPREWVCALAAMIGIELPEEIPADWREQVARTGQRPVPAALHEEHNTGADSAARVMLVMETARAIERLHEVSPLLGA